MAEGSASGTLQSVPCTGRDRRGTRSPLLNESAGGKPHPDLPCGGPGEPRAGRPPLGRPRWGTDDLSSLRSQAGSSLEPDTAGGAAVPLLGWGRGCCLGAAAQSSHPPRESLRPAGDSSMMIFPKVVAGAWLLPSLSTLLSGLFGRCAACRSMSAFSKQVTACASSRLPAVCRTSIQVSMSRPALHSSHLLPESLLQIWGSGWAPSSCPLWAGGASLDWPWSCPF